MPLSGILKEIDLSARGRMRVWVVTALGTLACIAIALAFDSYAFDTGEFQLSDTWFNNIVIPLILAPPIFYYLLSKLRELAIAHDELVNIASTDSLTSCLNRRAFTALVEGYLERVANRPEGAEGALLIVDIDHFKKINDTFGHDRGDDALRAIAGAIRTSVREIDLVGRLGGEEFGVFLPGLSVASTTGVAERIRLAIRDTIFAPGGRRHKLSASIGGATFNHAASYAELYNTADKLLYAAKRNGRNRIEIRQPPPADPPPRQRMLH